MAVKDKFLLSDDDFESLKVGLIPSASSMLIGSKAFGEKLLDPARGGIIYNMVGEPADFTYRDAPASREGSGRQFYGGGTGYELPVESGPATTAYPAPSHGQKYGGGSGYPVEPLILPVVYGYAALASTAPEQFQHRSLWIERDWPWATSWLAPVLKRVLYLLRLRDNWDGYGARPINREDAADALIFLRRLMAPDTSPPSVVPLSEGGVQVEWHSGGVDIEVTFATAGERNLYCGDRTTGEEFEGSIERGIGALRGLLERVV